MKLISYGYPRGFTLIEIIATLVIVAVLGTLVYTYFGKALTESVAPVTQLKQSGALHRVMQNIIADYNVYPKWRRGEAYALNSIVVPSNPNRRYYTCTTGGTSSSTEPDWLNSGPTYTEATGVKWTDSGSLKTHPRYLTANITPLAYIKSKIGAENSEETANEYGKNSDGTYTSYTVVRNRFVQFVNNVEADDAGGANNILKVSLKSATGETLTALFVSD
jgi:prepilin-type N-terminal cleavage/methylation domain-containing protein